MSLFITFEGVEGSGKTTQISRLKRYLTRKGIPCKVTREPGGPPISEKVRKILLNPDHREMVPLSELFLYEAARAQDVKEVIEPLLKKGVMVLCDRFSDATIAYQGFWSKIELRIDRKAQSAFHSRERARCDVSLRLPWLCRPTHASASRSEPAFDAPSFKEVAFRTPIPAREVIRRAREKGVHPGYALGRDYEGMDDVLLVAVTEKRTDEDVDRLDEVLEGVCR